MQTSAVTVIQAKQLVTQIINNSANGRCNHDATLAVIDEMQ